MFGLIIKALGGYLSVSDSNLFNRFFLIVFSRVYADVLFVDDCEDSLVGKTPKKWEHLEFASGNKEILVEIDSKDKKNKAAKTTGIGLWIPEVAGRGDWKDHIWDFDWM